MIIHVIHEMLHRYSVEQLESFLESIKREDEDPMFVQLESRSEMISFLKKEIEHKRKESDFTE